MNHLAVDLGSKQSQVCLRSSDGRIVDERKRKTRDLRQVFEALESPTRVILETSSEAFTVAGWAKTAGHDVRVVPSTLSRSLGVGARGVKTDQRDAQTLSRVSCAIELEGVHVPSTVALERKALGTSRQALVTARTQLINNVRGYLRTQVLHVVSGKNTTFTRRVRQLLEARPEGLPLHLNAVMTVIDSLTEQILGLDRQVAEIAKNDETCTRLMTMPGVGPLTAMMFQATVDQVKRFSDAHKLESYIGLTPGESSSGETERKTGITHAGSARLRFLLVQAAWSAMRTRPNDPMVQWAKNLAARRNKQIAAVALARKMTGILYALWRDETTYTPAPTTT